MSTEKPWLRPSMLPKLALCGHYRSEVDAGEAAARGTKMDTAFREEMDESDDDGFMSESQAEAAEAALLDPVQKLIAGVNVDVSGLDEEEREAIRWAVDTAKAFAGDASPESREERLKIAIFGMNGTADLLCLEHCWSADLKSGQKRNYVEQQAAYALAFMEELFLDEWTVYLFYCDLREVERLDFTRESAMAAVRAALASANSGEPPRVNDFCGWCARRFECPARRESMGIIPFDGPNVIAFEQATNEQLRDFALRVTYLEDCKKKVRQILIDRVLKGAQINGVSRCAGKTSRKIEVQHLLPAIMANTREALKVLGKTTEAKARSIWEESGTHELFPGDKVETANGAAYVRVSTPKEKAIK